MKPFGIELCVFGHQGVRTRFKMVIHDKDAWIESFPGIWDKISTTSVSIGGLGIGIAGRVLTESEMKKISLPIVTDVQSRELAAS